MYVIKLRHFKLLWLKLDPFGIWVVLSEAASDTIMWSPRLFRSNFHRKWVASLFDSEIQVTSVMLLPQVLQLLEPQAKLSISHFSRGSSLHCNFLCIVLQGLNDGTVDTWSRITLEDPEWLVRYLKCCTLDTWIAVVELFRPRLDIQNWRGKGCQNSAADARESEAAGASRMSRWRSTESRHSTQKSTSSTFT